MDEIKKELNNAYRMLSAIPVSGDAVDVTVMTTSDGLTKEEVAQIRDIVLSKCQVTAQNITIVEVK